METIELQETPQRSAEPEPPAPASLRGQIGYCLRVWLGVRIGLSVLVLGAIALIPVNPPPTVPGWPNPANSPGWGNLATAWERWDALWFLRIADQGYQIDDGSAAFFPLYPATVRLVSEAMGGHRLPAALLVSNLAFLAALVVVYRLTEFEFGTSRARRTVLYLSLFPTAFFFFAPYSESLFLLLAAASIYAARRSSWLWAGVCGALASATRSIGLVLVAALAIEAIRYGFAGRDARERVKRWTRGLAAAALVATGTGAYLAYWKITEGDWWVPLQKQGGWAREFSLPWETLAQASGQALKFIGVFPGGYHLLDWLIVLVVAAAAVWVALRAAASYGVYVWLSLVIPLSFVFGGRPLMSVTRFAITMFPLFWALDAFAERFRAHDLVVAASAAGLGAFTLLFVNWYWIF